MLAPPGGAAAVASLVRDDLQEPGAHRLAGAETAERAPRLDEPVLGRVLGVGCVAGDDVGHSECDLLVRTHELLVRARVSTLGAQRELPLVLWTALHARTTPRFAQEFQRWLPSRGGPARRHQPRRARGRRHRRGARLVRAVLRARAARAHRLADGVRRHGRPVPRARARRDAARRPRAALRARRRRQGGGARRARSGGRRADARAELLVPRPVGQPRAGRRLPRDPVHEDAERCCAGWGSSSRRRRARRRSCARRACSSPSCFVGWKRSRRAPFAVATESKGESFENAYLGSADRRPSCVFAVGAQAAPDPGPSGTSGIVPVRGYAKPPVGANLIYHGGPVMGNGAADTASCSGSSMSTPRPTRSRRRRAGRFACRR